MRDAMIGAMKIEGLTVVGSTGQTVANPLLRRMADIDAELRQLEGQLGLSPSARATIGLGEVRVQSKLDEMMARRAGRS